MIFHFYYFQKIPQKIIKNATPTPKCHLAAEHVRAAGWGLQGAMPNLWEAAENEQPECEGVDHPPECAFGAEKVV